MKSKIFFISFAICLVLNLNCKKEEKRICQPEIKICSGNEVKICRCNGQGYRTIARCRNNEKCIHGECQPVESKDRDASQVKDVAKEPDVKSKLDSKPTFEAGPWPDVPVGNIIDLPQVRLSSSMSLEEAIKKRRSVRSYSTDPLTLKEVSQILWSAQGITGALGNYPLRAAPSAGALYPLEIYLFVGNVADLSPGVYKYIPIRHKIYKIIDGDKRRALWEACHSQDWVLNAALDLVLTSVDERTTWKYGPRGIQYIFIEVGHVAQNIHLQCIALGLKSCPIGAFEDKKIIKILSLPEGEYPRYVITIGR
jgi:SagB-type dehydrogenase family enzyme